MLTDISTTAFGNKGRSLLFCSWRRCAWRQMPQQQHRQKTNLITYHPERDDTTCKEQKLLAKNQKTICEQQKKTLPTSPPSSLGSRGRVGLGKQTKTTEVARTPPKTYYPPLRRRENALKKKRNVRPRQPSTVSVQKHEHHLAACASYNSSDGNSESKQNISQPGSTSIPHCFVC